MKKSTVREAQMRMLDILIEIDRICNDNDIKYWLDSGTLLGAIRHKGFIPWDDDLDIGMLREDYKKFIKIIDKSLDEKFYCQTPLSDKKCKNAFIKIRDKRSKIIDRNGEELGIFIDIFPYDYLTKKTHIYKKLYNSIIFIKWMGDLKFKKPFFKLIHKNIVIGVCKVLSIFYKIIPYEGIIKHMYNNANKLEFIKTDKIIYGIEVPFREKVLIDDIFPLKYHTFENRNFPVPRNYEEILKIFFNDWNKLPPKELQVPTHSDEIFIS